MRARKKGAYLLVLGVIALIVSVGVPLLIAHLTAVGIRQQVTIGPSNGDSYASWLYDDSGTDQFLLFNVTNPYEIVEQGARPRVAAIGPFVYKTINERLDPVFDAAAGTVRFFQRTHYVFDAATTAQLTDGNITHDGLVITAVNVQLHGVIQQAIAAERGGDALDALGLAAAVFSPLNALPSTAPGGPPSCCDALPAGDCLTVHPRGAGLCGCGNLSTCATEPPPLSDWAGRADDTGLFVRISCRELLFGYEGSSLMGVVNAVLSSFGHNQTTQPTNWQGLERNASAAAARLNGAFTVRTGSRDLQQAHRLLEVNGNTTIVACSGSPCVRATFEGFSEAWGGADANAVRGSLGGQFTPGRANLEGSSQEVLATQLFRKLKITNARELGSGGGGGGSGAGEMLTFKGIPLLKFTLDPSVWAPSAAYYQTQQGMWNMTSVEQDAKIRITKVGFADFIPSPAGGGASPGQPDPVTALMVNPGFFAAVRTPDGSSWLDESVFGVEPTLGTAMYAHERFQISVELGPAVLGDAAHADHRTFNAAVMPSYIPVYCDDSGGTIPDRDADKLKGETALTDGLTRYSQLVGGVLCGLCLVAGALLLRRGAAEEADERKAHSEPLMRAGGGNTPDHHGYDGRGEQHSEWGGQQQGHGQG